MDQVSTDYIYLDESSILYPHASTSQHETAAPLGEENREITPVNFALVAPSIMASPEEEMAAILAVVVVDPTILSSNVLIADIFNLESKYGLSTWVSSSLAARVCAATQLNDSFRC